MESFINYYPYEYLKGDKNGRIFDNYWNIL
jgi:hypothetical protein